MNTYSDKELACYVGERIRHYRKNLKLTQKDLGNKIKKSNNTISDYENGVTAPNQDALFDLARALHVKVDDFFPPRKFSESLHDTLNPDDNFTIQNMKSYKELTAYLNTLTDSQRQEVLRNIDVALNIVKDTHMSKIDSN